VVHRPLRLGCGRGQLGLDPVEERRQVQALRALAYTLGGEAPVGARGPRVRVVLPGQAQRLLLGVLAHDVGVRSEEHTSELQSRENLVCRLLLEKKKTTGASLRSVDATTVIVFTGTWIGATKVANPSGTFCRLWEIAEVVAGRSVIGRARL